MKTLLIIIVIFTSYSLAQNNLVSLKGKVDEDIIFRCESDIYFDTTNIGNMFLENSRFIMDARYQDRFYSKSSFYYYQNHDSEVELFNNVKSEYTVDDINSNLVELKLKFKEIEETTGKIIFEQSEHKDQAFYIEFESLVNCEEYREKLLKLSEHFFCSFDCYPFVFLASVESEANSFIEVNEDKILINKAIQNIRLIDLLGNYQIIEYKSEIDINNLQRGVYILQFTHEGEIFTYKFIKE